MNSVFENVFDLNPYQRHLLAVGLRHGNVRYGNLDAGRIFDPHIHRDIVQKFYDIKERAKKKAEELAHHVRERYKKAHEHVTHVVQKAKEHIVKYLKPHWEDALESVKGLLENVSRVGPSLVVLNEVLAMIHEKRKRIKQKMDMNDDQYKKFKREIRDAEDKVNEAMSKLEELNAHNKRLMDVS